MKMASYVVIYPNIVGISLGHKYRLEWMVVANGLRILAKNDACLLEGHFINGSERPIDVRLLGDLKGPPINGPFWPVYQLALRAI